ncbi:hypothetical protein FRC18_006322 [Serendipita sp. 400]|nr:hypothetical protein FRC18_006322 [Serendipita sp. 400]
MRPLVLLIEFGFFPPGWLFSPLARSEYGTPLVPIWPFSSTLFPPLSLYLFIPPPSMLLIIATTAIVLVAVVAVAAAAVTVYCCRCVSTLKNLTMNTRLHRCVD